MDVKHDPLVNASKEAVNYIIKNIGVGTTISEIGEWSEEIVGSYETEINGTIVPIKPINNLCGHSIKPWTIHAGKFIQPIRNNDQTKIEEDDILAIEIFTSTGAGTTILDNKSSHYMLKSNYTENPKLIFNNSRKLLNIIEKKFKTSLLFLEFTCWFVTMVQRIYNSFLAKLYVRT